MKFAVAVAVAVAFASLCMAQNPPSQPTDRCRVTIDRANGEVATHEVTLAGDRGVHSFADSTHAAGISGAKMSGCPDHIVCQLSDRTGTLASIPFANAMPLTGDFSRMARIECQHCGSQRDPDESVIRIAVTPEVHGWPYIDMRLKVFYQDGRGGSIVFGRPAALQQAAIVSGPDRALCVIETSDPSISDGFSKSRPYSTPINNAVGFSCLV